MLLAIDIGNTNIVIGCIRGDEILFKARIATDRTRTSDQYGVEIKNMLEAFGVRRDDIDDCIISSVVPQVFNSVKTGVIKIIGKQPIYVKKDALGFIANRLQAAILREALYIKEQGIGDFSDIDGAMKYGLGFRYACLGPLEVVDQGGLDIHHHIATYLWEDLADDKYPSGIFEELYQEGKYGVKSGAGFYDYSGDKADKAIKKRDAMYLAMAKANPTAVEAE